MYTPDFYDNTDFECILTNLELEKLGRDRFGLPLVERQRTENILRRAIQVEEGVVDQLEVTEEHPDGLDVSLFHDESQLTKKNQKSDGESSGNSSDDESFLQRTFLLQEMIKFEENLSLYINSKLSMKDDEILYEAIIDFEHYFMKTR